MVDLLFGTVMVINFIKTETSDETNVDVIISSCNKLASSKTGALIVLERNNNLDFLISTGDEMNIKVTQPILESIFFKNSPLHDGAVIIKNNIVVLLPLYFCAKNSTLIAPGLNRLHYL